MTLHGLEIFILKFCYETQVHDRPYVQFVHGLSMEKDVASIFTAVSITTAIQKHKRTWRTFQKTSEQTAHTAVTTQHKTQSATSLVYHAVSHPGDIQAAIELSHKSIINLLQL